MARGSLERVDEEVAGSLEVEDERGVVGRFGERARLAREHGAREGLGGEIPSLRHEEPAVVVTSHRAPREPRRFGGARAAIGEGVTRDRRGDVGEDEPGPRPRREPPRERGDRADREHGRGGREPQAASVVGDDHEALPLGVELEIERQAAGLLLVDHPHRRPAATDEEHHPRRPYRDDPAQARRGPRFERHARSLEDEALHDPSSMPEPRDPAGDVEREAKVGERRRELAQGEAAQGDRGGELEADACPRDRQLELRARRALARAGPSRPLGRRRAVTREGRRRAGHESSWKA
jgi:hypothetical protein